MFRLVVCRRVRVEREAAAVARGSLRRRAFRRRWRLGERLANAMLVRQRRGAGRVLLHPGRHVAQQHASADAGVRGRRGLCDGGVALSSANASQDGGAFDAAARGAAAALRRAARRLSPRDPRAGGAARQLGISARVARPRSRVRAGVKTAAVVALVVPGPRDAAAALRVRPRIQRRALLHAALGLAGAIVLLEALMVNYDKVPFTCTYVPSENMKALAPIYAIAFVVGASLFAQVEYDLLRGANVIRALVMLGAVFGVARLMSRKRARLPQIDFDEAPVTFQRLGLDR